LCHQEHTITEHIYVDNEVDKSERCPKTVQIDATMREKSIELPKEMLDSIQKDQDVEVVLVLNGTKSIKFKLKDKHIKDISVPSFIISNEIIYEKMEYYICKDNKNYKILCNTIIDITSEVTLFVPKLLIEDKQFKIINLKKHEFSIFIYGRDLLINYFEFIGKTQSDYINSKPIYIKEHMKFPLFIYAYTLLEYNFKYNSQEDVCRIANKKFGLSGYSQSTLSRIYVAQCMKENIFKEQFITEDKRYIYDEMYYAEYNVKFIHKDDGRFIHYNYRRTILRNLFESTIAERGPVQFHMRIRGDRGTRPLRALYPCIILSG
jgi:hypothetical protein